MAIYRGGERIDDERSTMKYKQTDLMLDLTIMKLVMMKMKIKNEIDYN